jgi:hypothetical protein
MLDGAAQRKESPGTGAGRAGEQADADRTRLRARGGEERPQDPTLARAGVARQQERTTPTEAGLSPGLHQRRHQRCSAGERGRVTEVGGRPGQHDGAAGVQGLVQARQLVEIGEQRLGRWIAVVRVLLQQTGDDEAHTGRDVRAKAAHVRRRQGGMLADDLGRVPRLKRRVPDECFEQHRPERVEVRPGVDRTLEEAGLLRRGIVKRPRPARRAARPPASRPGRSRSAGHDHRPRARCWPARRPGGRDPGDGGPRAPR